MNMKYSIFALLVVAILGSSGFAAAGGEGLVTLNVLMIQAQNDPAPMDRRLEKVEFKLRRVFGFQHYRFEGEGSITLNPWGEGFIDLPQDYRLWIKRADKGKAEVSWFRGKEVLLSALVGISRDAPVVLGGIPSNGGKLILVLTAP